MTLIAPQEGFQRQFVESEAEIVIGGGAAGCGKTFVLLMEALRNIKASKYRGVIFRRTTPQIRNAGGLWDESTELYNGIAGTDPKDYKLLWTFPSGAEISFSHLEYEKNVYDHQGGQYGFIGFDELTHFTKKMFFYLLSRNRSTCNIPYVRATCNPDPESWVYDLIKWWIDEETGLPIPERSGVVRYFINLDNTYFWGDTKQEVLAKLPDVSEFLSKDVFAVDLIKSITFIAGNLFQNRKLLQNNPEYLANLLSLDPVEKSRLLGGSWKYIPDEMGLFDYKAIQDLWTNKSEEIPNMNRVACDVARFGSDWAVVTPIKGASVKQIRILTKSTLVEVAEEIEKARVVAECGKRDCYVDVDGLGAGVVDFGGYTGFQNGGAPVDPFEAKKDASKKSLYANLKTQCYYFLANQINFSKLSLEGVEIYVDGVKTDFAKYKVQVVNVREQVNKQLRAIKRKNPDMDGKKQINPKEEQKEKLGGMSPDIADTLMISMFPFIKPKVSFVFETF